MDKHQQNEEAARAARGAPAPPDEDARAPDELRRRGFPRGLRLLFLALVLGVALYRHFQGAS